MEKQKKIIFVNSFKGGTGKTTLSLSHCVDALFHTKEYENVIYLDLDVLGTATEYLFEEGKLPSEESFDKTSKLKKIKLKSGSEVGILYVGYLSPEMKNSSMYGEACFIHHQGIAEEIFIKRVLDFIEEQMNKDMDSLIVLDCAPGFAETEQKILDSCYRKASKMGVKIDEEYLVTLDSAHVKKCIQCLKDNMMTIETTNRSICMVVNDVQNFCDYLKENGRNENDVLDGIMKQIYSETSKMNMAYRLWKYSQDIAVNSIYTMRTSFENQVDVYRFTKGNYIEWKEGSGFV